MRAEEPVVPGSLRFAEPLPEDVVDAAWRLKTTLGRGGFGVVFEAERVDDPEEVVALKVIAPEPDEDGRWDGRFVQEAEVAMRLSHPNVIRTLGHGRLDGGARYLVMELLEGETLRDRLRSGRGLRWPEVAHVLESLGAGLGAVHDADIVHRDVKPSNVFLDGGDGDGGRAKVKLFDFGLCKGPSALTASMEHVGTVPYIAPELLRAGARAATPSADVYAMALVAYEVVTGRRAIAGATVAEMVGRILRGPSPPPIPELRADAPAPLLRAIEAGMERDHSRRPAGAAAYGRQLAMACPAP